MKLKKIKFYKHIIKFYLNIITYKLHDSKISQMKMKLNDKISQIKLNDIKKS